MPSNTTKRLIANALGWASADPSRGLDALIDWKMGSPGALRMKQGGTLTEEQMMQRQFTMELRVDFADENKLPEIRATLLRAARHCVATARLLSDNQKSTKIVVYCDDWMVTAQEIDLMEDLIQKGLDQIGTVEDAQNEGLDADLLEALRDG